MLALPAQLRKSFWRSLREKNRSSTKDKVSIQSDQPVLHVGVEELAITDRMPLQG